MSKIGINLRVIESSSQGGRAYMEDRYSVHFQKNDEGKFEYAYFGIFDGHGGAEAAKFARDNLRDEIVKYPSFYSENDDEVLLAIKAGFLDTHHKMWKELDNWPKTKSGFPSTAGTTASIGIIRNCKLYVGHVGDSGIALGSRERESTSVHGTLITEEHKPSCQEEKARIENCGGEVVAKAGVQRVVWNRPKLTHKGPIRRSTPIDRIPFLAVARSLGDLWSYNYAQEEFVVSPEPDVFIRKLCAKKDTCLVFGSDGLWNMLSADDCTRLVTDMDKDFEDRIINDPTVPMTYWINPAERLVTVALNRWMSMTVRADNTSAIVVFLDPPGPSKMSRLKKKRDEKQQREAGKQSSPSEKHQRINDPGTCGIHMMGQSPESSSYTSSPSLANHSNSAVLRARSADLNDSKLIIGTPPTKNSADRASPVSHMTLIREHKKPPSLQKSISFNSVFAPRANQIENILKGSQDIRGHILRQNNQPDCAITRQVKASHKLENNSHSKAICNSHKAVVSKSGSLPDIKKADDKNGSEIQSLHSVDSVNMHCRNAGQNTMKKHKKKPSSDIHRSQTENATVSWSNRLRHLQHASIKLRTRPSLKAIKVNRLNVNKKTRKQPGCLSTVLKSCYPIDLHVTVLKKGIKRKCDIISEPINVKRLRRHVVPQS